MVHVNYSKCLHYVASMCGCDRIYAIQQLDPSIVCLNKGKQETFSLAH